MSWQPLTEEAENELHRSRLLRVEENPFKRITGKLLHKDALIKNPSRLPTPPPASGDFSLAAEAEKLAEEHAAFREDVLLDFANFDHSLARLQFLHNSNAGERERYKESRQHILDTAQAVKENTASLRSQLEESKRTLEQRKRYDEAAEKITNNVLLRPRKDQEANLKKLEEECRELERESGSYAVTWKERREQFGRIVEEGMQLRRLIRDEKEEVERREGMEGEAEEGDDRTPKGDGQEVATPRADAGELLDVGKTRRGGSRSRSRGRSPAASMAGDEGDAVADTPMEGGEEGIPQVTIKQPEDDVEEGETEDKMDTT